MDLFNPTRNQLWILVTIAVCINGKHTGEYKMEPICKSLILCQNDLVSLCEVISTHVNGSCLRIVYFDTSLTTEESDVLDWHISKCGRPFSSHHFRINSTIPRMSSKMLLSNNSCTAIIASKSNLKHIVFDQGINISGIYLCRINVIHCSYPLFGIQSTHHQHSMHLFLYVMNPPRSVTVRPDVKELYPSSTRKKFVIATLAYEPFVIKLSGENGSVIYSGLCFDILDALAKFLNFEYTVVEPPDQEFGVQNENGTWSGMIRQVLDQEVDFAVNAFTLTKQREEVIEFMVPFWEEPTSFMIKMPQEETLSLYANPFRKETWIIVLLAVALSAFFIGFFDAVYTLMASHVELNCWRKFDKHFQMPLIKTFGYLVNQGSVELPPKAPAKIFISCFWILTISLVATYSGNLIAFLTVKKLNLPVNSLEELAEHREYEAGTGAGGAIFDLFKHAKSGVFKKVWDNNIVTNPENNVPISYEGTLFGLHRVQTENFVLLGEITYFANLISTENVCDVIIAKENFYKAYFAFTAPKEFPYLNNFNTGILKMTEAGLLRKWQRMYWPKENGTCDKSFSALGKAQATLANVTGAYIVLGIGMTAAFLVLLAEIFVHTLYAFVYRSSKRKGCNKDTI